MTHDEDCPVFVLPDEPPAPLEVAPEEPSMLIETNDVIVRAGDIRVIKRPRGK